jgi:hypothetical protein
MISTLLHEFLGGFMQRHLPAVCVSVGVFGLLLGCISPATRKYFNVMAEALAVFLIWLGFKSKET